MTNNRGHKMASPFCIFHFCPTIFLAMEHAEWARHLASAGCNYFMGVPCADDVMLNYQSTSFHDAALVRRLLNLNPVPEFAAWLTERGIWRGGQLAPQSKIVLQLQEIIDQ